MPLASSSMTQTSEELQLTLMNSDSANLGRIAGDRHHNDATTPSPVVSASPFPHLSLNETSSQCYSKEAHGGNSMTVTSQFRGSQNSQMNPSSLYEGHEDNSLPHRPVSGFPCPEEYIGWPNQNARHGNLLISDDMTNAAFSLNSSVMPYSGGKCATSRDSLASRLQMGTPSGTSMSSNIGQLNTNLGMSLFNQNQGGAGPLPLLNARKLDERLITAGSGSNKETKSNASMPRVNVTGTSERPHIPSINTLQNQLSNFINSGLDMNSAFSGFQNDSGIMSDLAQTGGQEVMFDSIPGTHSGPSYAFQRPYDFQRPAADQNHCLSQVNKDSGPGGVEDIGQGHGFKRSMVLPPFPSVGSPSMPCGSRQRSGDGQQVPSSIRVVTNQLPFVQQQQQQQQQQKPYSTPFVQLPQNNLKILSQSQASAPFRSIRGQDPPIGIVTNQSPIVQQQQQQQLQQLKLLSQSQASAPFRSIRGQDPPIGMVTNQSPIVQQQQQLQQLKLSSQSQASAPFRSIRGQDPPIGVVTNHSPIVQQQQQQQQQLHQKPYVTPFVQLPQNNVKLLSQSLASAPFRSTRGQDPSSNHGQSKVDGSIQQSKTPLRRHYAPDQGIQIGKGNMTAQVSRQSIIPSLKRPASQPPSSTVQEQRRKTLPTQPFAHPPIQPWTRFPPSLPNTPQAIAPLVHAPRSLTPQATQSFVPPFSPTSSSVPALNTTQTTRPLMHTAPFVPPIDKRVLPSRPLSNPHPLPNQQHLIAQSLARQRLMNQIIQSAPITAHNYIKYKDQTPEPIGYKCMLCKRDLSYAPEGPISQPPTTPPVAVLSCGHTFHQHCLEQMTSDDKSKDPPCIPCALGE